MTFISYGLAICAMAGLCAACGNDSGTSVATPKAVEIQFNAVAGTQALACGVDLTGLGTAATTARLLDFAFFVHDVKLVRQDGSTEPLALDKNDWQNDAVALVTFPAKDTDCSGADKPVHAVINGMLPRDEPFTGLQFTLGVPAALNHADATTAVAPLNATNMFWSWQSGYKSMRLDLTPAGGITRPTDPDFAGTDYFFHLGSTDCTGDPTKGEAVSCARVNQPVVTLSGFTPSKSVVTVDIAPLVAGQNLTVDAANMPGCMSSPEDPECAGYFSKLGLDLTSGAFAPPAQQDVFVVR